FVLFTYILVAIKPGLFPFFTLPGREFFFDLIYNHTYRGSLTIVLMYRGFYHTIQSIYQCAPLIIKELYNIRLLFCHEPCKVGLNTCVSKYEGESSSYLLIPVFSVIFHPVLKV